MNIQLIAAVIQLRDLLVAFAFNHNRDDLFDVACDLTRWLLSYGSDYRVDFAG